MLKLNFFRKAKKRNLEKKVVLHLGLHKTATTYIQSLLELNSNELKIHNIDYINLETTRRLITRPIKNKSLRSIRSNISEYLTSRQLIISDENILGELSLIRQNSFYPLAKKKLKKILDLFYDFDVEVFIVLRNYNDYMPSRYSEHLRHWDFKTYNEYYKKIKNDQFYWLNLIKIISSLGVQKIVVSNFDNIIKNKEKYLDNMIGQNLDLSYELELNEEILRSKITSEVYDVLNYAAKKLNPCISKKILNVIEKNYDSQSKQCLFRDIKTQEVLDELYKRELEEIKNLANIRFLEL